MAKNITDAETLEGALARKVPQRFEFIDFSPSSSLIVFNASKGPEEDNEVFTDEWKVLFVKKIINHRKP